MAGLLQPSCSSPSSAQREDRVGLVMGLGFFFVSVCVGLLFLVVKRRRRSTYASRARWGIRGVPAVGRCCKGSARWH